MLRSRMTTQVNNLVGLYERSGHPLESFDLVVRYADPDDIRITPPVSAMPPISPEPRDAQAAKDREPLADEVPEFVAIKPSYRLDQVVLPAQTQEALLDCVSFVEVTPLVFGTWGLSSIEPHPSIAVNFRGPPGTGKTMAAHAAASHLGRKIMLSRVSDL